MTPATGFPSVSTTRPLIAWSFVNRRASLSAFLRVASGYFGSSHATPWPGFMANTQKYAGTAFGTSALNVPSSAVVATFTAIARSSWLMFGAR